MKRLFALGVTFLLCLQTPYAFAGPGNGNDRNNNNEHREHEGNGRDSKDRTSTPIKHLVVIFDENISFDHYFGTYPEALNPKGEPKFVAAPNTPKVNGLTYQLLHKNPNLNSANGDGAANPFRLGRSQASTNDQDNDYSPEQMAYDGGKLDLFPLNTGAAGNALGNTVPGAPGPFNTNGLVMAYFDGNTVTAMWNYAQHYAMSDNYFETTFGDSTLGAVNLVSGQTNGVIDLINGNSDEINGGNGSITLIGEPDPENDVCSDPTEDLAYLGGKNIGNLLNDHHVTWGWFSAGFDLSVTNSNGTSGCDRSSSSTVTGVVNDNDYSPHREPFQYYPSTANPTHIRPSSVANIGYSDKANHQYDLHDFMDAVNSGNMPAVSFLKPPTIQSGHSGESDPLDEQEFVVNTINFIQQSKFWDSTAIILTYDDSDGWYDHQMGPIVNSSVGLADFLNGNGVCGNQERILPGIDPGNEHAYARCGHGPRLPILVISPWAKKNYVDHSLTDQTSVLRFIEDNWLSGERIGQGSFDTIANSLEGMFDFRNEECTKHLVRLQLDPNTGEIVSEESH
jgi:phospholipase C